MYLISGSSGTPTPFDYEIAYKQQTYVKLTSKQVPSMKTFVALVKFYGIRYYDNVIVSDRFYAGFEIAEQEWLS